VVRVSLRSRLLTTGGQCLLTLGNRDNATGIESMLRPEPAGPRLDALQQIFHLRDDRNESFLRVFTLRDINLPARIIDILPADSSRLADPRAAVSQKFDQIGAPFRIP
jgi:hypothetical protein